MAISRIRVLFGCTAWPSGMLDVASWAKHEGLAEPVIFQMQPGRVCRLDAEQRACLVAGPIDAGLRETLAQGGVELSAESRLERTGGSTWTIKQAPPANTCRIVDSPAGLDVLLPERFEGRQFAAPIRAYAAAHGPAERFLDQEGAFTPAVREALWTLGGRFIVKLIEFRPHVVGFRFEGAELDEIRCQVERRTPVLRRGDRARRADRHQPCPRGAGGLGRRLRVRRRGRGAVQFVLATVAATRLAGAGRRDPRPDV